MRSQELQIGDWVYFGKDEYSPSKIDGILPYDEGVVLDFDNEPISNDNIRPIPLTAEILEKNGWKEYPQVYSRQKLRFDICRFEDEVGIILQDNCIVLKYVHELQHALRLCGLVELADSLII